MTSRIRVWTFAIAAVMAAIVGTLGAVALLANDGPALLAWAAGVCAAALLTLLACAEMRTGSRSCPG